jgi:beta-glucosidase-like glycosyl hydrolase
MLEKTFATNGTVDLEINVACDVVLTQSEDDNEVRVTIEGDEQSLEEFEIHQSSDRTVTVKQNQGRFTNNFGNSNVVIGNGMSVTQVNGATYINNVRAGNSVHIGEIYINGKRVTNEFDDQDFKPIQPTKVTVYCPESISLDLDLRGQATFKSQVHLTEATIDCSGQVKVAITSVEDLNLDVSGQSTFLVSDAQGKLIVDVSGQSQIEVDGAFDKVSVDVSGQSSVVTRGICHGNYIADASGMGRISHYGTVEGRVKKDCSGMGSINV